MRAPWFWQSDRFSARLVAKLLSPLGSLYHAGAKARQVFTRAKNHDGCAVVCIGNATVGGVGKTPFAIMLKKMFDQHKIYAAFLSRGYGGTLKGPILVDTKKHSREDVGDEALLLAQHGPVWVAKNRAKGVESARKSGMQCIIADDGFQNPSLQKDLSILLVGVSAPSGKNLSNKHVFPAGPFREPMSDALKRADMVFFVRQKQKTKLSPKIKTKLGKKPHGIVWLAKAQDLEIPVGPIHAFCGIANPHRFKLTLKDAGFTIEEFKTFPDHHIFSDVELNTLQFKAREASRPLMTTEKDYVRLTEEQRNYVHFYPVAMRTDSAGKLWQLIQDVLVKKGIIELTDHVDQ